jgi:hypothetical protein
MKHNLRWIAAQFGQVLDFFSFRRQMMKFLLDHSYFFPSGLWYRCDFGNGIKLGAKFDLGNGDRKHFWTDRWFGNAPLSVRFARLFEISADPERLVSQMYNVGTLAKRNA